MDSAKYRIAFETPTAYDIAMIRTVRGRQETRFEPPAMSVVASAHNCFLPTLVYLLGVVRNESIHDMAYSFF